MVIPEKQEDAISSTKAEIDSNESPHEVDPEILTNGDGAELPEIGVEALLEHLNHTGEGGAEMLICFDPEIDEDGVLIGARIDNVVVSLHTIDFIGLMYRSQYYNFGVIRVMIGERSFEY